MSKLQLILLGRFECLLSSGTRISLPMRKAEVLLAYLALTPGLRHPRERLINLLWSDRGEEQRYWSIAARSACNRD
jgi:DNA-binding SARP family transcriptional activator